MVSFVWIKNFLNINMFRQNISILPKLHFLAEMDTKKVLTSTSTRMPSYSFCVLWFPSTVEWTFTEPHSFICPTIKMQRYFKHVVKWTMSLGQAAQLQECGTGIPLCTHPTPSLATPGDASAPTSPRGARTKCLLLEVSVTSAHPQQPGWLIQRDISIPLSPRFKTSFFT